MWHPAKFTKSINHFFHTVTHRHDTAHIWGTKNQFIWTWQSSQLFCCSVSNISWKCHWNPFTNFSVMFLVSMDTENIKIKIVTCLIFDLSWKFHENPFTCFSVMLLTDTDFPEKIEKEIMYARGLTEHPQKVPDCSLCQVWPILQLSWNLFTRFPVIWLTDKQTNKYG